MGLGKWEDGKEREGRDERGKKGRGGREKEERKWKKRRGKLGEDVSLLVFKSRRRWGPQVSARGPRWQNTGLVRFIMNFSYETGF